MSSTGRSLRMLLANTTATDNGRPSKPIRLMVGLLMLKQLEYLPDENVVLQFKRNPYYQYFCGYPTYTPVMPCNATERVYFRNRIGVAGFELIFKMSVMLHGKKANENTVLIDTTVQEKNITYPTDSKPAIKIINHLNKLAKQHGIKQRRTFVKEVKDCRLRIRHFRHVKKRASAKKALKRLRTIAHILIRELQRKLPQHGLLETYQPDFLFYQRELAQQPKDKNKIYSLHKPHAYSMGKGKTINAMNTAIKYPSSREKTVTSLSASSAIRKTSMMQNPTRCDKTSQ